MAGDVNMFFHDDGGPDYSVAEIEIMIAGEWYLYCCSCFAFLLHSVCHDKVVTVVT